MPQKKYQAEEIIGKLREPEILSSQGRDVDEVCRKISVVSSFLRHSWRHPFPASDLSQVRGERPSPRLKALERW